MCFKYSFILFVAPIYWKLGRIIWKITNISFSKQKAKNEKVSLNYLISKQKFATFLRIKSYSVRPTHVAAGEIGKKIKERSILIGLTFLSFLYNFSCFFAKKDRNERIKKHQSPLTRITWQARTENRRNATLKKAVDARQTPKFLRISIKFARTVLSFFFLLRLLHSIYCFYVCSCLITKSLSCILLLHTINNQKGSLQPNWKPRALVCVCVRSA